MLDRVLKWGMRVVTLLGSFWAASAPAAESSSWICGGNDEVTFGSSCCVGFGMVEMATVVEQVPYVRTVPARGAVIYFSSVWVVVSRGVVDKTV